MNSDVSRSVSSQVASARTSLMFMIVLRLVFLLVLMSVGWGLAADKRIVTGALAGQGDLIMIGFTGENHRRGNNGGGPGPGAGRCAAK